MIRSVAVFLVLIGGCFSPGIHAQSVDRLGLEYNYYPAGHIAALQFEWSHNNHNAWNIRVAVNRSLRQDFSGLNDDERGWGPGVSLGYRRYLVDHTCNGVYLGLRTDFWWMTINWKDQNDIPSSGTTKIKVLQPTMEIGYGFPVRKDWRLNAAVVNGMEWNVVTKGADVGQGWITLLQLSVVKNLHLSEKRSMINTTW
ncbi:MAG: hypothetical protein H6608_05030 [Flavobacteriales bacterium]|nr:hypothetical protein [Bacteroidota bacterium]MCB9240468.1 hypothetical protein [Flavobacteriales bacterium]